MDNSTFGITDKITLTGHVAFDTISQVPYFPKINHSIPITNIKKYPGGGAGNIAVNLEKLGCRSQLLSVVGKDFPGSYYEKRLQELKIDLCLEHISEPTAHAFIFVDENKHQKTYFYWGASKYINKVRPVKCKILHLAPCDPTFCINMIPHAEYIGFEPGQDIQQYSAKNLRFCLERSNIFFCNNYELHQSQDILGISSQEVLELVDMAVVTYGEQGSALYKKGEVFKVPALKVKVVDPTGAGDGYRAGFWAAKVRGLDDIVACKMGSITSSYVVQKWGGQSHLPAWQMLEKKYKDNFGKL